MRPINIQCESKFQNKNVIVVNLQGLAIDAFQDEHVFNAHVANEPILRHGFFRNSSHSIIRKTRVKGHHFDWIITQKFHPAG